jgi:uncharacterized protein YndB with AHSA1/START domain
MLRDLKLNIFYPYSPERVWQAITNRRVLAQWLMENDFEPRLGHKFQFQPEPNQGINEAIHCEVVELDKPRSLSYTWRGGFIGKPTIVTWRLIPVEGGTQLQLEHKGFESHVPAISQPIHLEKTGQYNSISKPFFEMRIPEIMGQKMPISTGYGRVEGIDTITLNFYLDGGWHSALNNRLQNLLNDVAQQKDLTSVAFNS